MNLQITVKGAIAISLASFAMFPASLQAVTQESMTTNLQLPSRGAPTSRRVGAGSRDPNSCPKVEVPLTALVPENSVGLTHSENPLFLYYIPYTVGPDNPLQFQLIDEQDQTIYETALPLPNSPGIISIQVPKDIKFLEPGKPYHWILTFSCNPEKDTEELTVNGYIKRVVLCPEVQAELEAATTVMERIQIYSKNKLWYNSLAELAPVYRSNPQNKVFADQWKQLLQSVGLEDLISLPFVEF